MRRSWKSGASIIWRAKMPPITVIPTCADLDRFRIQRPLQTDPFVLGYVGSVGTWYLLDEMLRCFVLLREQVPGARLLIVNRGEHPLIAERAAAHGIAPRSWSWSPRPTTRCRR